MQSTKKQKAKRNEGIRERLLVGSYYRFEYENEKAIEYRKMNPEYENRAKV